MSRVQSEAKAMLDQLVKENGDAAAYQYAGIYAQWGDMKTALKWIERAYEVKDPGLALYEGRSHAGTDPARATLSSRRPQAEFSGLRVLRSGSYSNC